MSTDKIVVYDGIECEVKKLNYTNGRVALLLVDTKDGSLITTATINVPEKELKPHEVIIKNYSENEGILDVLIENNIVEVTGEWVMTGYVACPICILKI